jgi:hypothetical protein
MKIEWPWKNRKITLEKDVRGVEKHLQHLLQPVAPRPEFIKTLRAELVGEQDDDKKTILNGSWRKGVLVAGGVFSFFAMVLGGIRILIAILGMLQVNKKKGMEEPVIA